MLVADDDPLVRLALAHLVHRDPNISVIGEAGNGEEAIRGVEESQPDIVMMDVQMPVMNGIQATEVISERWPEVRILAVTTLDSREIVLPMLGAGATGYMLKDSSAEDFISALKQAYEGESSLSPRVAAMLVQHVRGSGIEPVKSAFSPLTEREHEVLQLLATGKSNAEMAEALQVSEGTIKAHLGKIMTKWDVRDRVQVLVTAARAGLVRFS